MVRTMAKATNAPFHSVVKMASPSPSRLVGIAANHGSLEVGKLADILLLSGELEIEAVYLAGQEFV